MPVFSANWNAVGQFQAVGNKTWPSEVQGQVAFTSSGTYTWFPPQGVQSVSVVCVGGGGGGTNGCIGWSKGGGGGELRYQTSVAVTPGS